MTADTPSTSGSNAGQAPTLTMDTPFELEDDTYHVPTSPDLLWLETTWFSFSVPDRRLGGWLHAGRHTNRGTVSWRVYVWDPTGSDPGRLPYYRTAVDVPIDDDVDLRNITFPSGGFSQRMLTPLMDYHISYADPAARFSVEFEHRSVHAPARFTPGEAPMVNNPHLDQLGHLTGELVLDGERIPIDCYSVRDRTWGPRTGHHSSGGDFAEAPTRSRIKNPGGAHWRQIERERGRGRIQYIFGSTEAETGFLGFVRPQDGSADGWSPLNVGWLIKDGEFQRLDKTKSRMKNYRDPKTGWSAHMEVELVDLTGRRMEAEGVVMSHVCEHNAGSSASVRWEYDGKVGWGEDQDGWRVDHFARMLRALRSVR